MAHLSTDLMPCNMQHHSMIEGRGRWHAENGAWVIAPEDTVRTKVYFAEAGVTFEFHHRDGRTSWLSYNAVGLK